MSRPVDWRLTSQMKGYFDPLYEDLRFDNNGRRVAFEPGKDGAMVMVEYVPSKPARKTFDSFSSAQRRSPQEDWRNREQWPQYERAVCDMVNRTSTDIAPWTLIEANDKYHARLKIMKTLCERIEAKL